MATLRPREGLREQDVLAAAPGVQILQLEGGLFGLTASGDFFGLEGLDVEGLRDVLAHVDGKRTVAEIVGALSEKYDGADVLALLGELHHTALRTVPTAQDEDALARSRLVVLGTGDLAREIRRELLAHGFTDVSVVDPQAELAEEDAFRARLRSVEVFSSARDADRGFRMTASKAGLRGQLEGAALVLSALEGAYGQALLDLNAACAQASVPVLFVTAQTESISVGPLTVPGASACFACGMLSTLLRARFETDGPALLPFLRFGAYAASAPRWVLARAATEVASEAVSVVLGSPYPKRVGSLLTIDASGDVRVNVVGPVSTCPACRGHHRGAVLTADAAPSLPEIRREPSTIRDRTGGTRSVEPTAAYERAMRALEAFGVDLVCSPLPSDAPEALLALQCPYYTVRQVARFSTSAPVVWPTFDDNCFGKGTTESQALCSAVFEWIERNMASWRGDVDLVRAAYSDVRDRAINMPYLVSGLLPGLPLGRIREFEVDYPIDWVWGHCLRRKRPILIPAACVYLSPTFFRGSSLELTGRGSSGLSAGCTIGDATLQGLLEVVERDAHYVALRNGLLLPSIDVDSVSDAGSCTIVESMKEAGYTLHLRDITTELGIPSVEAYLVSDREYTHHFASGYGAHLDPEIAVRRAISEAAQALFWDIAKGRVEPEQASASLFNVFAHRKQALERRGERRRLDELPRLLDPGTPVWDQVDRVVALVGEAVPAADVCMVDLSHPKLEGVHVVRTLVSGMLDEARDIRIHVPSRCRRVPLAEMYLGRAMH